MYSNLFLPVPGFVSERIPSRSPSGRRSSSSSIPCPENQSPREYERSSNPLKMKSFSKLFLCNVFNCNFSSTITTYNRSRVRFSIYLLKALILISFTSSRVSYFSRSEWPERSWEFSRCKHRRTSSRATENSSFPENKNFTQLWIRNSYFQKKRKITYFLLPFRFNGSWQSLKNISITNYGRS